MAMYIWWVSFNGNSLSESRNKSLLLHVADTSYTSLQNPRYGSYKIGQAVLLSIGEIYHIKYRFIHNYFY